MKKIVVLLMIALLLLAGCAAGSNDLVNTPTDDGEPAGFWMGLWHGIIAPIAFIISLFKDSLGIYEVHNNGNWYNFGYIFGLMITLGGSSGSAGSYSRRRRY